MTYIVRYRDKDGVWKREKIEATSLADAFEKAEKKYPWVAGVTATKLHGEKLCTRQ